MRGTISFFKTSILFAALTGLLIAVGYIIAGRSGAILFFMISLVMNIGSYWFSDKIALSMSKASPIEESQAPQIYADVRDISQKMGLPMPRIYMNEEMQPNAFATGRNANHAVICVTRGLLQILNRDEVRGVLAHEMGHIKNHDILISTVAAVIAGAISSIVNIFAWFGMGSDDENRNPLASLALIILAPIAAVIIQLAISRSREYAADAASAEFTGRPNDLVNALIKIDSSVNQIPMDVSPAMSTLYIENPLRNNGGISSLFSTHPSTADRVAKLMEIENELKS